MRGMNASRIGHERRIVKDDFFGCSLGLGLRMIRVKAVFGIGVRNRVMENIVIRLG